MNQQPDMLQQALDACGIIPEEPEIDIMQLMHECGIALEPTIGQVHVLNPRRWKELTVDIAKYGHDGPECYICGRHYRNPKKLLAHMANVHKAMTLKCEECGESFNSCKLLAHHRQHRHSEVCQ